MCVRTMGQYILLEIGQLRLDLVSEENMQYTEVKYTVYTTLQPSTDRTKI